MRRAVSLGVLSMAVICGSGPAWAQGDRSRAGDVPSTTARRLEGEIQVDGSLNEAAWRTAPDIAGFVQVEPRSGEAPTETTNVWIVYSRNALYIAVRCGTPTRGRSLPPTCAGTRAWKRTTTSSSSSTRTTTTGTRTTSPPTRRARSWTGGSPRTANRPPSGTASGSCERGSTKPAGLPNSRFPSRPSDSIRASASGDLTSPAHGSRERDVPVGFTLAGRRALQVVRAGNLAGSTGCRRAWPGHQAIRDHGRHA